VLLVVQLLGLHHATLSPMLLLYSFASHAAAAVVVSAVHMAF
jgi:hypothetical protein